MTSTDASGGLQRFIDAQSPRIDGILAEISAGDKTSHWMWFVFPQLRGLGTSAMADRYGIAGLAEFGRVIGRYFAGVRDDRTLGLLAAAAPGTWRDDAGSGPED